MNQGKLQIISRTYKSLENLNINVIDKRLIKALRYLNIMHKFAKLRNTIAQRQSYTDFQKKFQRYNLCHTKQLNLLLQFAIEQKVRDFDMHLALLLKKGADINYIVDQQQKTLLMLACQQTNQQIVSALLAHEDLKISQVNHCGQNALYYALRNKQRQQRVSIIKRLLIENELVIQMKNSKIQSILFKLIQLSLSQLLKLFLQKQFNCHEYNSQGESLLYHTFKVYHIKRTLDSKQCIQLLLKYIDKYYIQKYKKSLESFPEIIKQFKQYFIEKQQEQTIPLKQFSSFSSSKQYRSIDISKKILQVNGNNTLLNCSTNRQDNKLENDSKQCKHQKSHSHQNSKNVKHADNTYKEHWQTATFTSNKNNKKKTLHYKEKKQQRKCIQKNFDDEDKIMRETCDDSVREMSNLDIEEVSQEILNIKSKFLSICNQESSESQQQMLQGIVSSQQPQFLQIPNYLSISQQIYEFATYCERQREIGWHRIAPFYQHLLKIANKFHMQIDMIGSFANTLWLPYCDIDFIFIPTTQRNISLQQTLESIFRQLKYSKQKLSIVEIYFNKSSTFPTIKLQLNEHLNNQKIDIAIFYKNSNGKKYVNEIIKAINIFPVIKPIFFFLRRISQCYQLHDQKKGGLKTYALFLLIFQVISYWADYSLGEILERIAFYYGFCYEYDYQIEQKNLIMKLNLIDPLNINNNVGGKKTETLKLQKMFKSIYYGIHRIRNESLSSYLIQLSKIL